MKQISFIAVIAAALSLTISGEPQTQVSEIGLYAPDLRAIRQLIGPGGNPSLPPGDDYNMVAKSWNRLSRKGREFLQREPEIALVVVSSNGKWLYRSTGTIGLRPLFNPGEALTPNDAKSLSEILESPLCAQLRDFYQAVLFGTGPYSPNGSRSGASPAAPYGLLLASLNQADLSAPDKDWFRRLIGLEILALDRDSRDAVSADQVYATSIAQAIDAIERAKKQQFGSVVNLSMKSSTRQVGIDDLALTPPSNDASEMGPFAVSTVAGKRVLSWSNSREVIFIVPKNENVNLAVEFDKQSLAALLRSGDARVFVSSPLVDEIFEVTAAPAGHDKGVGNRAGREKAGRDKK